MRNIKTLILSFFAFSAVMFCASCSKEEPSPDVPQGESGNDPFEVTIQGELGEFAPSTKSTAESCVRMKWYDDDIVYAYGSDGSSIKYLGSLSVTVEENNDYVAVMTGTLSAAPADPDNTLYLLHSPLLTSAPEISGDTLTVDMKTQSANVIPFVAYSTVQNVTRKDKYASTCLKTKFSFATSVLKINATGICRNADLTSAAINDIETACKLTLNSSAGAFEIIVDESKGTITKALSGTASLSGACFCIGVPKFTASASGRILTIKAGGEDYYDYDVMQKAYDENRYVNYVYDVKTLKYVDEYGQDRGNGIYLATTGLVWAPVNCGYEPKNFKYGKLYQWGRMDGCGYKDTHDSNSDAGGEIQTKRSGASAPISASDEVSSVFYNILSPYNDWLTPKDDSRWDTTGGSSETHTPSKSTMDPCPPGWRVPTLAELNALKGERWSGELQTGTHGVVENVKGKYFDGSDKSIPTSGLFLPAAGMRHSGGPSGREDSGNYWSSSVSEEDAYHLSFNGSLTYTATYYRPEAYSVRCVQE